MRFSLNLLLERAHIDPGLFEVMPYADEKEKYTDIRLQYTSLEKGSPDILYLLLSEGILCSGKGNVLLRFPDKKAEDMLIFFTSMQETFCMLRKQLGLFYDAVCQRKNLKTLIEMFYDLLGNPAYMVDSSFKVLAIDSRNDMRLLSAKWKRLEDDGYLPYDIVAGLIESEELGLIETGQEASLIKSDFFYVPFINFNMYRKERIIGHLFVAAMFKSITPGDVEMVSLLGPLVLQAVLADKQYQNERGRYYEYFLTDILSGKLSDPAEVKKQMERRGYKKHSWHVVCMFYLKSQNDVHYERISSQLERLTGCKPIHYKDTIAMVVPVKDEEGSEDIAKKLTISAEKFLFSGGVSDRFRGFDMISQAALQAEASLMFSREREEYIVLSYQNCAIRDLLEHRLMAESHYTFPAALDLLRRMEDKNHGSLLETLLVFLENERNVIETANRLYIHRNTLAYRIRKLVELTGLDLENPDVRLRCLLALKLWKSDVDKKAH